MHRCACHICLPDADLMDMPTEQAAGCLAAGILIAESSPHRLADTQGGRAGSPGFGWGEQRARSVQIAFVTWGRHRTGFHQCLTPSPADATPSVSVVLPWGQGQRLSDEIVRKFVVSAIISVTISDISLSLYTMSVVFLKYLCDL